MKIRCARDQLYEAIQTVQRAVSGRSTLPILNNILLEAQGDGLSLTAYDLEFGIECRVEVTVDAEGGITIPARILAEVVGALPDAEITLTVDDQQVVGIRCGTSTYSIHGLPAEEFPRLPILGTGATADIARNDLRTLIRSTAFASSVDETRPILTGVLTILDTDALTMIATDTHRLAWRRAALNAAASEPASAIVPGRVYGEILRIVGSSDADTATIQICESQAQFRLGTVSVQSRLIDGEFPNWQRVVPAQQTISVATELEVLRQAIRRASIVAREDANKVIFAAEADGLTITADSQEIGSAREEVAATIEGGPIRIGFNARYFLDALNVIDAEEVQLGLNGPVESGIITPVGSDDYRYVLMPMQLS